MIFRYPEQEVIFHASPVPLQVVFRELENIVLEHGIEPIIYRISIGCSGPESELRRRIEIQCGPFLYSDIVISEIKKHFTNKYGQELICVHRKRYDKIPARVILEIPHHWADQPKVFLNRFGYIKGGNHS